MENHEEQFIPAFLERRYRDRCLAKKGIPRGDLWHVLPEKLDDRKTVELPSNVHVAERIIPVLRHLTRAESGFRISADPGKDGSRIDLGDLDNSDGTIVSVIPGKLAYYQAEHGSPTFQCLLISDAEQMKDAVSALSLIHI